MSAELSAGRVAVVKCHCPYCPEHINNTSGPGVGPLVPMGKLINRLKNEAAKNIGIGGSAEVLAEGRVGIAVVQLDGHEPRERTTTLRT